MQLAEKVTNERIISLDIIKILAAFMVIIYHFRAMDFGFVENQFYFPNLNKLCLGFCAMSVPLFFMVNGKLMLDKESKFRYFLLKSIKVLGLYIFWMFFMKFIASILFKVDIIETSSSVTLHLWFLRTLSILYFLCFFLKKFYNNKILFGIICVLLIIFPFGYNYFLIVCKYNHIPFFERMDRTGFFTMYSILYYFAGKFLFDICYKLHNMKLYRFFEIGSIVFGWILLNAEVVLWTNLNNKLFDGVNASFPTLGTLFMALGTFSLLCRIKNVKNIRVKKIICFLSGNIMGVYLLHPIVIVFIKKVITCKMNIVQVSALAIFVMVLSAMITSIIKKIPMIKSIFKI